MNSFPLHAILTATILVGLIACTAHEEAEVDEIDTGNDELCPGEGCEGGERTPDTIDKDDPTAVDPNGTRPSDCVVVFGCLWACHPDDDSCVQRCLDTATPRGQAEALDVFGCIEGHCADASSETEFERCATAWCSEPITACFGDWQSGQGGELICLGDCALDTDCPEGQTCLDVTGHGNLACVEDMHIPLGAPHCNPDGTCAPHSTCYEVAPNSDVGYCLMPCQLDADCPEGQTCLDVTGHGDLECVQDDAVPVGNPVCDDRTPCPTGWDGCFVPRH